MIKDLFRHRVSDLLARVPSTDPATATVTVLPITVYGGGGGGGSSGGVSLTSSLETKVERIAARLQTHEAMVEYLARHHPDILQTFYAQRDATKKLLGE